MLFLYFVRETILPFVLMFSLDLFLFFFYFSQCVPSLSLMCQNEMKAQRN